MFKDFSWDAYAVLSLLTGVVFVGIFGVMLGAIAPPSVLKGVYTGYWILSVLMYAVSTFGNYFSKDESGKATFSEWRSVSLIFISVAFISTIGWSVSLYLRGELF